MILRFLRHLARPLPVLQRLSLGSLGSSLVSMRFLHVSLELLTTEGTLV